MRLIFLLCAFVTLSAPVFAQSAIQVSQPQNHLTSKDLKNFCKGQYDIDYGYCAGYLAAVSEIMIDHEIYGTRACGHGPVASTQLMELMQGYYKSNPSAELQPASVATAQALSRFFSCR